MTLKTEAVFISDLHLHPDNASITHRFYQFIDWAIEHTSSLYILGDFFHVWAGDDAMDDWSREIAKRLHHVSQSMPVYFMAGNRDFLIGKEFIQRAGMTLLQEPAVLSFGEKPVLLVHGDRFCTKDKSHQWFRKITRNRFFTQWFLWIPLILRQKMVSRVREISQSQPYHSERMSVVPEVMLAYMKHNQVSTVIHGHTHKPGVSEYLYEGSLHQQYVLSDWDDMPQILCYDHSKGFYFIQICNLKGDTHG